MSDPINNAPTPVADDHEVDLRRIITQKGIILALSGLLFLFVGVGILSFVEPPSKELYASNGTYKIFLYNIFTIVLSSVGMTLLLAGTVEYANGRTVLKLFEKVSSKQHTKTQQRIAKSFNKSHVVVDERLARIVFQKELPNITDTKELEEILQQVVSQKTGRKKRFLGQKGSAYQYLGKKFLDILSGPYREDVNAVIEITEKDNTHFIVEEILDYTCRTGAGVDGNPAKLQGEIRYKLPDVMWGHADLTKCKVTITSDGTSTSYDSESNENKITIVKGTHDDSNRGRHIDPILLGDDNRFNDTDKVYVHIVASYEMEKDKILTWRMSQTSGNVVLDVTIPPNYKIFSSEFIVIDDTIENAGKIIHDPDIAPRKWIFQSNHYQWMLPKDGFVFRIVPTPPTQTLPPQENQPNGEESPSQTVQTGESSINYSRK